VSSAAAPRKRPAAGLPRSASEGVADWGSPFFWVLFFGEAKKSTSPAGARPGPGKPRQSGTSMAPTQPKTSNGASKKSAPENIRSAVHHRRGSQLRPAAPPAAVPPHRPVPPAPSPAPPPLRRTHAPPPRSHAAPPPHRPSAAHPPAWRHRHAADRCGR